MLPSPAVTFISLLLSAIGLPFEARDPLSTLIPTLEPAFTFIIPSFIILSASPNFRYIPILLPAPTFIIPVPVFLTLLVYALIALPPSSRTAIPALFPPPNDIVPLFSTVLVLATKEDSFIPILLPPCNVIFLPALFIALTVAPGELSASTCIPIE